MEIKDLPQLEEATESDHVVSSISQKTRLISFKNIFEKISFSSLLTTAKNIIGSINELKGRCDTLDTSVSNLNTDKLDKNKQIKIVAVQDSCVTDSDQSGMDTYPYRGTIWGTAIKNQIIALKSSGYTILGGFLVSGPLNDSESTQGYPVGHGLILQTSCMDNVPVTFTVNSTGSQTMRVVVAILYI